MPTYDVSIPGRGDFSVESPTQLTDQQAYLAVLRQIGEPPAPEAPVETPKPKDRTWGEAFKDVGASLTSGVGSLAQIPGQVGMLAGAFSPEEADTGLQGIGRRLEKTGQEMKSEALKAKEAARAEKIGQAEGVASEFWTAIKETASDPALMTSFFAEQVPNLIGSMGGGLLTKGAVKLAMRNATEETLAKAAAKGLVDKSAVAGAVGTGAVMQGADIGTDTFERIYDRLMKEGMSREQAAEIALEKGRMAALQAATISGATAFLPGGTTIERALVGRGLPRTGGIAKGLAGEAAQEGLEEGGGQLVSNIQERSLFPETDIFKGVGEAAGMGSLMGGVFGGVGGVSLRGRPTAPTPEAIPEAITEPAPTEEVPVGAPVRTEAASEAAEIGELERPLESQYEFEPEAPVAQPPVEQPPLEQQISEPVAPPVAEPVQTEAPVEQPEATLFDPAPFVERYAVDGVPALTNQLRNDIGNEIQSQIDAGNRVVATYNGEPVEITGFDKGNFVGADGQSMSPFWFIGFPGQEQNQIRIQKPAEATVEQQIAEPVTEPVATPQTSNWPSDIPTSLFRGYGRTDKGAAYGAMSSGVPVAGRAKYFAFDQESASEFGPNIETAEAPMQNPYVIRDGNQWRKLTKEAGWTVPNPSMMSSSEVEEMTDRLQQILKNRGYDGMLVYWDHNSPFDVGPKGENYKLLNSVFGIPQAVVFDGAKKPEAKPAAQLPADVHPLEAWAEDGVENAEAIRQKATQAANNAGINVRYGVNKIDPERTKVDWDRISQFPTVGGLLKHIQPHVPVDYAEIIKKIMPSVQNIPLNVVNKLSGSPRALGAYRPSIVKATGDVVAHRIELSTANNGNDISTIVHEALHGATVSNYYRGKNGDERYAQAAKELDSLARKLRKLHKDGNAKFSFMDSYKVNQIPRELISWGQTDRDVQAQLKQIVLPNKKTAWSEFVNTMRKLLGLPANQTTALDRLLDISERLTSQQDVMLGKPTARATEETIAKEATDKKPEGFPSPRATALGGNLTAEPWTIEPLSDLSYWERFKNNKVYEYVNKFVDLDEIIKAINSSTKKLNERWNASLRENLYHKRVDKQIADFQEKELEPLAREMVARGVSQEELNNFLLARHAEEYNKAINERNDRPDLRDRGSGVHSMIANAYMRGASPAEMSAIVAGLKGDKLTLTKDEEALVADNAKMTPAKRKAMEALAKRVDSIVRKTQDIAVEGGLEKSDETGKSPTVEYWREKYPHYVPLKRDPDELDFVDTSSGIGRGFGARAGMGKAATGSLKSVDNILMNIMIQRDMAVTKAEKARIGRALYAMALEHPNPNFWLPINPNAAIIGKTNDLGFEIAKLKEKLEAAQNTEKAKRARGELVSDGELKRIQDMVDELANKQARYSEMSRQSAIVKQKMEQELMAMGLDADAVQNLIREPQGAFYNPGTGKVEYRTNNYLRSSANVLAIPVNGETRFIFFNPGDERAKRLVTSLRGADIEQLGAVTSMMGKFTRWVSLVNTQYNPFFGIVNMIRDVQGAQFNLSTTPLAGQQMAVNKNIYSAARTIYRSLRSGKPEGEFAADWEELQQRGGTTAAKDMLVDQQKKTSSLEKMLKDLQRNPTDAMMRKSAKAVFNWMSDFNDTMENAVRLSAFIEAKKKFAKMYPNNPELAADKAAALAKNLTVNFNRKGAKTKFVNSWYAFFNAAVQGTARMVETLKGPAGKKIMGSLFLLGVIQQMVLSAAGFDDNDPPEFVREKNIVIPVGGGEYLSWPMPLGFNMFVNFGRIATSSVESGGKNIAKDMANLLGVMADSLSPVGGGTLSQAVTPTPFDPYFAVQQNVDQFGRPIYREDRPSQPTPGYLRSTEGATGISKFFAEALNRISGGTEFQKGAVSPTADEIDYYAGQIGGGSYREARKVVEFAKNIATGEETAPYRVPLAGRFMGDTGSEANVRNKFYENVNKLAGYEAEIKGRLPKGTAGEFIAKHPDAVMYKTADSVYNEVTKINKLRKQMIERGASKEQLKELNDRKIDLMRQFNEAYDKVRPK